MNNFHIVPAQEIYMYESLRGQGYSDERIEDEVNRQAEFYSDIIDKGDVDYISAWHFTSHRLKDSILENGLRPRENTGMPGQDSQNSSHEDKVYFTAKGGYTSAGEGIADKIGGYPMAVHALLNPDNLVIDEDASLMYDFAESGLDEEDFYLASLAIFGTMAHVGDIYPERESESKGESFIVDYKIQDKDQHLCPELVREKFHERALASKKGQTSEDAEKIREEYELVRDNFGSQISIEEACKLLEKHNWLNSTQNLQDTLR